MRSIFTTTILLLATLSAAQIHTEREFGLLANGTHEVSGSLVNLPYPVKLHFAAGFNGKRVEFRDPGTGAVIALPNTKFGRGQGVGPNGTLGTFTIEIDGHGIVNPGGAALGVGNVVLHLAGTNYPISFTQTVAPLGSPKPQGVGESIMSGTYETGHIYYDAMTMAESESEAVIKEILKAYGVDAANITSNLYLNDEFGGVFAGGAAFGALESTWGAIGNTDVTYIAAGFARFIAQRTKEELNEAFFRKMKDQLNAYPELKTAFPKTSAFLNTIENYSYATVLQVLKEAFETDVENLPKNLYGIKDLKDTNCSTIYLKGSELADCKARMNGLSTFFTTTPEGRWTGLGLFTVKEIVGASDPATVLRDVAGSQEMRDLKVACAADEAQYNVAASIELAAFLSQSLLSKENDQIWISTDELKRLVSDTRKMKSYLGLLLAMELTAPTKVIITFHKTGGAPKTFGDVLNNQIHPVYAGTEAEVKALIRDLHAVFGSANSSAKRMITASDKAMETDAQTLYDYYATVTGAIRPIAENKVLAGFIGVDISAAYKKVTAILDPGVDLAYHVVTKRYSAAIYDATLLLNGVKPDVLDGPVAKSFLKYGTLIGTVAGAQSSDEVKQALEASVLPVGSSSIKRHSRWNISLNAYAGVFVGKATTLGKDTLRNVITNALDTIIKPRKSTTYGLYAPIGVSFSKGSKCGLGVSLTAQLFDLGALVNYYAVGGDETALPDGFQVRLANIFAPGIEAGINIPKTPLTIMGGYQYVPALYQTDQITSSAEILASNASRWHISLVVDIPLLNFMVVDLKN